jgi:hypothetical protein
LTAGYPDPFPSLLVIKPCKTLLISTPKIRKMYKGIRKRKREKLSMSKTDLLKEVG